MAASSANWLSESPSSVRSGSPTIENITQTAKKTVKAIVENTRTRIDSVLTSSGSEVLGGAPDRREGAICVDEVSTHMEFRA